MAKMVWGGNGYGGEMTRHREDVKFFLLGYARHLVAVSESRYPITPLLSDLGSGNFAKGFISKYHKQFLQKLRLLSPKCNVKLFSYWENGILAFK